MNFGLIPEEITNAFFSLFYMEAFPLFFIFLLQSHEMKKLLLSKNVGAPRMTNCSRFQ